jgi:hypothetical protein
VSKPAKSSKAVAPKAVTTPSATAAGAGATWYKKDKKLLELDAKDLESVKK